MITNERTSARWTAAPRSWPQRRQRPVRPPAPAHREHGLSIGEAARRSGVPAKTIRFYEAEGVIPPAERSSSGYRLYSENDVRRLRLVRRLRALGISLDAARDVAGNAFQSECQTYTRGLGELLETQCAEIDRQVAELLALRDELQGLVAQARVAAATAQAGLRVDECGICPAVDELEPTSASCPPPATQRVGAGATTGATAGTPYSGAAPLVATPAAAGTAAQ